MGTPGPKPEVTPEDALEVFTRVERPCTPLTATEVATELDCTRRTAHRKLEALSDRGDLHTKKTGARSRVWWRSPDAETAGAGSTAGEPSTDGSPTSAGSSEAASPAAGSAESTDGVARRDGPIEEQFGAFVSAVEDYAIFMLDPDGVVANWNDGAARIKGYVKSEIVGEHFSVFYEESAVERGVPETILETAREEGRTEAEGWRVRADGARFWADVTVTAVRDDEGSLLGYTKVTRDLTERREYERRLEAERDLLNRILDTSPVGILVRDADGAVTHANARVAEVLGISDEEVTAHSIPDLRFFDREGESVSVEDHPHSEALSTGERVSDRLVQLERPDGERRWLSMNAVPLTNDNGEVERIVTTGDDVTDLKERERQLRRERNQTEELLQTLPVPVEVQAADGETVIANQAAQDALGLSEEEFLQGPDDPEGWTYYAADGAELAPDETPSVRARTTGEPVSDEVVAVEPPDGERLWFSMNAAPVFDVDGDLHRVIVAAEDVTDLQERARTLETELSEILGRVSDAFYALDGEWRFTHANDRAAEFLRRSADDLLGESIWEVFPEVADGPVEERFREAMATQEPVTFEAFSEPLDGWFELNAYPSETGLSVYFQEVTERKARERQLEEYERIVETVSDGIYVVDEDLRFQLVNDGYVELSGYSREELLGSHISTVLDEEVVEISRDRREGMREGDAGGTTEGDLETATGETVTVEARYAPLSDTDGSFRGTVGVVRDVTERKERERYLRDAKMQLEAATEAGAVGTWEWQIPEDRFVAGTSLARTFGVDPDAASEGVPLDRLASAIHEDDRERVERAIEEAVETCGEYEAEYRAWNADGDLRWVFARGHVESDEDGDPVTFPGALIDITDRKRRERALEESEQRYRTLVEHFPNGAVALVDEDLTYRTVGGSPIDAADATPGELQGRPVTDAVPPAVADELVPRYEAALAGEAAACELDVGDEVYQLQFVPVRDDAGDVFAALGMSQDVTEQVEREREIKEQRERYRRLVDVAPVAIVTYDVDGEILFANDATADLVGVDDQDAVVGTAALDHIHPAEREEARERVRQMLEDRTEVPPNETRVVTADGGVRHALVTSVPITVDGEPAAQTVLADITEQKEREQALERYKTVFDTIEDGVYVLDEEFRFLEVNDAYAEMAGRCPDELVGEPCSLTVGDDLASRAADLAREMARGEREGATLEGDVVTPDGERVPGECKFTPLPTADGEFRGSVGVVRDLTERKAYERALETRARQQDAVADLGQRALETPTLEDLFDEAVAAVADTLGTDYCKVLDLSPDGEELLLRAGVGWREGLVGETTVSAVEADSQAPYTLSVDEPVVVEDLATEPRFSGPDLLRDHDVTSGISTVIGPPSDPWGVLGTHDTDERAFTGQDVTFVQSVANILTTAIERARYEEQLNETVEELQESNERLEQFAYIASHDLQEPLRMISNYLQLLEQRYGDALDEDGEEFLEFAVDGAERMREMIDGLLEYSRVETEAEPLEPTDTGEVVGNVLDDLRLRIEETDAEVAVGDLPTVVADDNQLEQVFRNLVSNALKYRGEDPPRIEVDAERGDGRWRFRVADNGIGLDSEHADRIFEVFRRLHTREEYPGTGIGLALCKKIVERHGGDIRVDSTPGEGATFYFTLPYRREDE